eukprot:5369522-Prymnesium_polylepis.2
MVSFSHWRGAHLDARQSLKLKAGCTLLRGRAIAAIEVTRSDVALLVTSTIGVHALQAARVALGCTVGLIGVQQLASIRAVDALRAGGDRARWRDAQTLACEGMGWAFR